eukprot:28515-Chlamydomonas_euryale.AAC.5
MALPLPAGGKSCELSPVVVNKSLTGRPARWLFLVGPSAAHWARGQDQGDSLPAGSEYDNGGFGRNFGVHMQGMLQEHPQPTQPRTKASAATTSAMSRGPAPLALPQSGLVHATDARDGFVCGVLLFPSQAWCMQPTPETGLFAESLVKTEAETMSATGSQPAIPHCSVVALPQPVPVMWCPLLLNNDTSTTLAKQADAVNKEFVAQS